MTIKEMIEATSEEYMLRQLSEECCELAQSALKLVRAFNNETPVSVEKARASLVEELADVKVMMQIIELGLLTPEEDVERTNIFFDKYERFQVRIANKDNPAT